MRALALEGEKVTALEDPVRIAAAHQAGSTLWLDLDAQTPEVDRLLAETFRLHPLCIEDIWSTDASPKIEQFPGVLYVLAHGMALRTGLQLEVRDVDIVIGKGFVITHHRSAQHAIDAVAEDLRRSPRLLERGPVWLAHALLDHLVDDFFPVMDALDDDLDGLENEVIAKAGLPEGRGLLSRIFSLKRTLQALRRTAIHQRELLLRLARGEFDVIPAEALPFFRDVSDHFVRVTDLAESYRDLVTSALDAYLSVQSNRMNEVMKTLTLISTVMLPVTFIAGVYGMNFKLMPELDWRYGYAFALGLMGVVAGGTMAWFKRRRWI